VTKVAFEPRSGYEDLSGSVSLPDGSSFDVGEALKSGGGRIALDPDQKDGEKAAHDRALVEAFSAFPGLKQASAESRKGNS
jgi:hypothetical protein